MPWCGQCDRFFNPNSVAPDGTCVHCGHFIGDHDPAGTGAVPERARAPWHFWLLVLAVVVYLGWRAVQGVAWVAQHI